MLFIGVVVDAAALISGPIWQHKVVAWSIEFLLDIHSGRKVLGGLEIHGVIQLLSWILGLGFGVLCMKGVEFMMEGVNLRSRHISVK